MRKSTIGVFLWILLVASGMPIFLAWWMSHAVLRPYTTMMVAIVCAVLPAVSALLAAHAHRPDTVVPVAPADGQLPQPHVRSELLPIAPAPETHL